MFQQFLTDESATLNLGATLATTIPDDESCIIHLEGELGAGKTTLTRGLLQQLGHVGKVKSPTYTLVEQYSLKQRNIYHFDLYRVSDAGELEFLGLDDFFSGNSLCLLEWAHNGLHYLPKADIEIHIDYRDTARQATVTAHSPLGERVCAKLNTNNGIAKECE